MLRFGEGLVTFKAPPWRTRVKRKRGKANGWVRRRGGCLIAHPSPASTGELCSPSTIKESSGPHGSGFWVIRGTVSTPRAPKRIALWLILPVVICLSQRLSHACLSIAGNSEAANSSLQQPLFLGSTLYLDNCGNSRANTCIKTRRKDGRIY
jgi:hypothetical protein